MLYLHPNSNFKIYNMTNGKSGRGGANSSYMYNSWIRESGVSHEVKGDTKKKFIRYRGPPSRCYILEKMEYPNSVSL